MESFPHAYIVPCGRLAEQQKRRGSIGVLYHAVLKLYLDRSRATLGLVHHRHLPLPQAPK